MVQCVTCEHWVKNPGRDGDAMARRGWAMCTVPSTDHMTALLRRCTWMSGTYERECSLHKECNHAVQSARRAYLKRQDAIHRGKFGGPERRAA